MPADPKRIKDLFMAVSDTPAADRAAVLDHECAGDADLRQRVVALLNAHDEPNSFLNRPAADGTGAYRPAYGLELGEVFAGRFKLREELGEGGMGLVFVADQLEPVQRRVALKVIKSGADSVRVLARFEQERQALALMDHPNIAKVFDAGVSDAGQPFFVMELIKGVPLTVYCDEARLTPRQRLDLFIPVCQAVQHAHQKGIIHRDLKPSNILVGLYDGRPVPKVIDFGVAKATGPRLSDHSIYTEVGSVIGTLEYMSPEQAELNNLDIDTRSDIYSLGVILYELLTGTVPFSRAELQSSGFVEMLRIIKEKEPPKPSTRLSASRELPTVAAVRHMEPAKLSKLIRGDLDWITMKSLEKDRSRRYETANGLAMDIQRYLEDEPVLAGPPSAGYKLKKFAQRNRAAVLTTVAVAAALLTGTVVASWQAVVATRAKQEAQVAAAAEKMATAAAEAEKQKAERAEAETLADYRASTDDAIEQLIGSKPDLGPQERAYLENTIKRWQSFANRQGDDERSRAISGEGHSSVAQLWAKLGRKEEARAEYQVAREIQKKLAAQFPNVPPHKFAQASTHNNLGLLLADLGNNDGARAEYEAAQEIQEKLAVQFPGMPVYRWALASACDNLGNLLAGVGKREEAAAKYHAARDMQRVLVSQFPGVPAYRFALAHTHTNLGMLLQNQGRGEDARTEFGAARDLEKKLVERFPAVPKYRRDLANTQNSVAALFAGVGKPVEARAAWEAARDIQKQLVEQFPAVPEYRELLATTHRNLGYFFFGLHSLGEARAECQAALALQKKLAEQFPSVLAYQNELAGTHNILGALARDVGKHEEARMEHLAAVVIQEKLAKEFPSVLSYQIELGVTYRNFGCLIRDEGKPAESLEWFDRSIRVLQPVYEKVPRDVAAKQCLRNSHWGRAVAHVSLQKPVDAIKDWDRAIDLSPPAEQPQHRAARASSRLRAGMFVEAVAEVDALTKTPNPTADQYYDFACFYAVASVTVTDRKTEFANRAMSLLQKAAAVGYANAVHMRADQDLEPLRNREDFKKLLTDLETKPAKPR